MIPREWFQEKPEDQRSFHFSHLRWVARLHVVFVPNWRHRSPYRASLRVGNPSVPPLPTPWAVRYFCQAGHVRRTLAHRGILPGPLCTNFHRGCYRRFFLLVAVHTSLIFGKWNLKKSIQHVRCAWNLTFYWVSFEAVVLAILQLQLAYNFPFCS